MYVNEVSLVIRRTSVSSLWTDKGVATSRIEFVSTRYSVESPPISLPEFGSSIS